MVAERARLVDVFSALSLTTDLATGLPFERGLRACLVADGLARALDLDPPDHRAAFLASLLRAIGCGHASENAALFGDDIVFERWDGRGMPGGRAGEAVHPIARIVGVAEQAAIAHAVGGLGAARAEIGRRAGGHLDPSLCDVFLVAAEEIVAPIEAAEDLVDAVRAAEPAPVLWLSTADLERPCHALATFADLKGFHLIGHSTHVTELTLEAARLPGFDRLAPWSASSPLCPTATGSTRSWCIC